MERSIVPLSRETFPLEEAEPCVSSRYKKEQNLSEDFTFPDWFYSQFKVDVKTHRFVWRKGIELQKWFFCSWQGRNIKFLTRENLPIHLLIMCKRVISWKTNGTDGLEGIVLAAMRFSTKSSIYSSAPFCACSSPLYFWATAFQMKSEDSFIYVEDYRDINMYLELYHGQSVEQLKYRYCSTERKADGFGTPTVSIVEKTSLSLVFSSAAINAGWICSECPLIL